MENVSGGSTDLKEANGHSSITGKAGDSKAGDSITDVKTGAKRPAIKKVSVSELAASRNLATVVKRNGLLVPFRRERIHHAIEAAFRACRGIQDSEPLSPEDHKSALLVTDSVVIECLKQGEAGSDALTVESIQDIVEVKLMQFEQFEVARTYIVYRGEHKQLREDSPQNLKLLRRDGKTEVRFNPVKIATAVENAFRSFYKIDAETPEADVPEAIMKAVNSVTQQVVESCVSLAKAGTRLHIELIQDEVERQMMSEGFYDVAKSFILYRAHRATIREAAVREAKADTEVSGSPIERKQIELPVIDEGRVFTLRDAQNKESTITEGELRRRIEFACQNLKDVSVSEVLDEAIRALYEGVKVHEIDSALVMAARSRIEKEPNYTYVAARLLLDITYRETVGVSVADKNFAKAHRAYFKTFLEKGIAEERVSPVLRGFDLEAIADALKLERDLQFQYLGLQTVYDRYLLMSGDIRLETPQIFWMRVAMGLSVGEGEQKTKRAIEFYDVLSQFLFVSSTPTLFNSGTMHAQMSSCYLSTTMDDLGHIFKVISDDAQLSKWAGGLGNDWTNVRATGARIKGTNGKSQGVIPFLKVANDTAVAVNQGGKRKGAMCAYLETWHLDVEDFMELRKNTGDERRRAHDMNTANWIPDLFMKRVEQKGNWTMFSPSDVPDLHDLTGKAFEKRYEEYEALADRGELKLFKRVEAVVIWRKMLSMIFETGHPWITFKDPSNIRSPQDHVGVVHSSNLCTEILLNTSKDETAVCNLGSINLATHTTKDGLDVELLSKTIRTAIRMLDNVIDLNFYPTTEAKSSNLKHRPIGLGIMGFQDSLYVRGISYASPGAVSFADESMEAISYYAILASTELAKERGTYQSYRGSKWDRGFLPIDTIELLEKERGGYLEVDSQVKLDWSVVRTAVKTHGMRNSNTMAIAPTATISNITGVAQSIEPSYKHLYAKSNLSGDFIVYNTHLVDDLKARDLWDEEMVDDLKYFDGEISEIARIPEELRKVYLTAFEIEPEWIIECASRRQKWIDMGQSLNLYIAEPSGKKLNDMYMLAWKKGLKTTYYLRSKGATQIEKSTTDINRRGLQPRWMKNKSASSEIKIGREDAETTTVTAIATATVSTGGVASATAAASGISSDVPRASCNLDGTCESCQ